MSEHPLTNTPSPLSLTLTNPTASSLTSTIQTELLTIKQGILDLGAVFLAPTADATHALYNSTFERLRESFKGTEVKRDVRYGEKERNVLDVSFERERAVRVRGKD